MEQLKFAIVIENLYNNMKLEDLVDIFQKYSNQQVPQKAIVEFKFTGLNNVDFLVSDYLHHYGLKTLMEF